MARVSPAIIFPACGSKVSNWLGPPAIQSIMTDLAGAWAPAFSWARPSKCATGVSHANPPRPVAVAWSIVRRVMWLLLLQGLEELFISMVPRKLG